MGIKQLFAGGVILAGLAAYATFDQANRYDQVAQAFNLTEGQVQVMRECRKSLSRHNRDFKEGVDQFRGCACVAKRLTDNVPDDQYPAASRMLDMIVERSATPSKIDLSQKIKADETVGSLAPVDMYRLVMNTTSAVGYCGRAKNHARQAVANVKIPKID
jgi:hypothetical protein